MSVCGEWKDYYSVGDESLDAQHRQIIGMINEVWAAVQKGGDRRAVTSVLDRLVLYTLAHFKHEERIMLECEYPEVVQHKALHDTIRRKTLALRDNASLLTSRDVLQFLKEWWIDHIQGEDKKYAPYLELSGSRR